MKTDGSLLIINQNNIHKCEQGFRLMNPVLKCLPINFGKLPLFRSVAPACDLILVNSQQLESLQAFKWECYKEKCDVKVIEDQCINAFCLKQNNTNSLKFV